MLKLGMVSSYHPHSMRERVERVTAKTDALRVQTGQTLSEYEGFGREFICYTSTSIFFKLIWTPDFFCVQYAAFKATSSISNMFWHHLLFFGHLPNCFRELNDREIENHYKMNSENVETWHGSSFDPHSMCERVERVTAKNGCISCTNWTNSFGVSGFRTRTHLLHGHFNVF